MTTKHGNYCTVQHAHEKHEIVVRPTCMGTAHTVPSKVHVNPHDLLHPDTFGKLTSAHANNIKGKSNCCVHERIRGDTGHKIVFSAENALRWK